MPSPVRFLTVVALTPALLATGAATATATPSVSDVRMRPAARAAAVVAPPVVAPLRSASVVPVRPVIRVVPKAAAKRKFSVGRAAGTPNVAPARTVTAVTVEVPASRVPSVSPVSRTATRSVPPAMPESLATRVLAEAAALAGIPYLYGGVSPDTGFDCSGFTQYVYARTGMTLPRTATQQWQATKPVPAASAAPGDLVFFGDATVKSHVGIYAGDGFIWDSPKPGKVISKRALWTTDVVYGRVIR